jgi:hypothetical protein
MMMDLVRGDWPCRSELYCDISGILVISIFKALKLETVQISKTSETGLTLTRFYHPKTGYIQNIII